MSRPFLVNVFLYGYEDVRLEADIVIPFPEGVSMLDQPFLQSQVNRIMPDLKHSYPMKCEFCGSPATENHLSFASFAHLPPRGVMWMGQPSPGPMANAYVHAVCRMSGACGKEAQGLANMAGMMALASGTPPERAGIQYNHFDKQKFPRNGSCGFCQTDESVKKAMSRCGKCKATLYCGPACQKNDWARHKQVCKWVKGIRFLNSSGKMKTRKENPDPIVRENVSA